MQALTIWKTVAADTSNLLERIIGLFSEHAIRYCVIDGQAINAYVEPLVDRNLELVVAVEQMNELESLLKSEFKVERFPHSVNVSLSGSNLRVQIQTDPRYADFVERAVKRDVLGLALPVASVEDVLRGKVWAAQDSTRRPSKRRKDLLDIERLLEAYPHLRVQVPEEILAKLVGAVWLILGLIVGALIGLIFGVFIGFSLYKRAGTWDGGQSTVNSEQSTIGTVDGQLFTVHGSLLTGVALPDFVTCLIGLVIGLIGGTIVGILIGMRLYWKTGHW